MPRKRRFRYRFRFKYEDESERWTPSAWATNKRKEALDRAAKCFGPLEQVWDYETKSALPNGDANATS